MGEEKNKIIDKFEDVDQDIEEVNQEEIENSKPEERTLEMQRKADESIGYLMSARNELLTLGKMTKALETLKLEERRLQKSIASEEKSIEDEVTQTVNRKRDEIEDKFESALRENKEKEKKLLAKRAKKKNEKVNERVKEETADVREENRSLLTKMDTMFKQEHVPSFCNTRLYYVLFMTKGLVEFLEFLAVIGICMGVVPALICIAVEESFLKGVKDLKLYFVIIFLVCIILLFLLYIFILNHTKVKHRDILIEGRKIRDKVKANHRKIRAITNAVRKDKDESQYNLEKYDQKLYEIKEEAKVIAAKRQEELTVFETKEKQQIIDAIRNRRRDGLEAVKRNYKENTEKYELGEKAIADQKEMIQEKYIRYLGEDFMDYDTLQDLITIIEEGDANTVEEAINFYNG